MPIIDTDELKAYIGITTTSDDEAIGFATDAANQAVVEHCGRSFDKLADPTARHYRAKRPYLLDVQDFWTTTGLVLATDEGDDGTYGTTWELDTDFILEPTDGLIDGQSRPYNRIVGINRQFLLWTRRPGVQVTAAWGWASIPDAVMQATLYLGHRLFKRRNSPEGAIGGFADYPVRVSRYEDPDVVRLLGPFVHPSKAALVG